MLISLFPLILAATQLPTIAANDNRTAAGFQREGRATVQLVAQRGMWHPESERGPGLVIFALGEDGRRLQNPAPLLRVAAGTLMTVTLRNELADTLVMHGLAEHPLAADDPWVVPPGAIAERTFPAGAAGTYLYWGTTGRHSLAKRKAVESQLSGAFVVDSQPGRPADRVFVIGVWIDSLTVGHERVEQEVPTINGKMFPFTDDLTFTVGDSIRWRWINASDRTHPMHLHGFYYRVDAEGDGRVDTNYAAEAQRMVVTETLLSGATMAMTWGPERPGNWVFHCHVLWHVAHFETLAAPPGESHGQASERMSGLVLMLHVRPGAGAPPPVATAEPQRLRLVAQARPGVYGSAPGYGFALQEGTEPARDSIRIPGPPLVLTRGRPVEITVVNHLPEATAVHWHGIELDSYYDGVPNMSGDAAHVMRSIAPGDSFLVRFTPPRAGTFMYHTHIHDPLQLQSGMYGPILVLEPGAKYDPSSDHVLLFSDAGPGGDTLPAPLFNGRYVPDTLELAAGRAHRLRFIIIPAAGDAEMQLTDDSGLVTWRALAKDGRDLPERSRTVRAARQYMAVGETYDYELPARTPGLLHVQIAIGPQVVWTAPIRIR
ncbi:MAG TPA: multicopper oxidase domain-containing protein [Gemmatimonadales bacterium]|nr:multicopper oxidase domain-containing protein [Gemmatimonadales bacterium]